MTEMTRQVLVVEQTSAGVALLHLDGVHLASPDMVVASKRLADVAPHTTGDVLPQAPAVAEVGPIALRTSNLEKDVIYINHTLPCYYL